MFASLTRSASASLVDFNVTVTVTVSVDCLRLTDAETETVAEFAPALRWARRTETEPKPQTDAATDDRPDQQFVRQIYAVQPFPTETLVKPVTPRSR